MTGEVSGRKPTRNRPADALPAGKGRKHRWTRRILFGVVALLALVVLGSWAFIKLQPTLPPLALSAASPPVGALDGTWAVSAGSVAGFRVPETAFGMSNDAVGRTTAVSGTVVISGDRVHERDGPHRPRRAQGKRQGPAAVRQEPRHPDLS